MKAGARQILIPDSTFDLEEIEVALVVRELRLIMRDGTTFDAAGAASKLLAARGDPITFDDAELLAVFRALTNLRDAGSLSEREGLGRLHYILAQMFQGWVAYELFLLGGVGGVELRPWTSYGGQLEVGDRFCTSDGEWRVTDIEEWHEGDTRLVCQPFADEFLPARARPPQ